MVIFLVELFLNVDDYFWESLSDRKAVEMAKKNI